MAHEGILSMDEARNLLRKFYTQDDVLAAAIDAYEVGGDERLVELTDSLRRIAKM